MVVLRETGTTSSRPPENTLCGHVIPESMSRSDLSTVSGPLQVRSPSSLPLSATPTRAGSGLREKIFPVAVSLKTHKMLWGRAASRCSVADCRRLLYREATESDSESLIGEACHIVAASPQGPRGDPLLPDDQMDEYQNLILLCAVHHKVVDDQPGKYSVQYLKEIKKSHEDWVMQSLSDYDPLQQKNPERYASYVDEWISRVDLENWRAWTSHLLAPDPRIDQKRFTHLTATRDWLLSPVWPDSHPRLREALTNFRNVLNDFLLTFRAHAQPFGEDSYITEAFYRIREWDPERYQKLLQRYEEHVDLIADLVLELTRAANFVCDQVTARALRRLSP